MKKLLSTEAQIIVLEKAKTYIIDAHKFSVALGLCFFIDKAICSYMIENLGIRMYSQEYKYLKKYIPLFTYKNASSVGEVQDKTHILWWPVGDLASRIAFLDWMISELKKELS